MLVILNKASFICVPAEASPFLCELPPKRGPLPAGARLTNVPQGSSILLDNCQIDSCVFCSRKLSYHSRQPANATLPRSKLMGNADVGLLRKWGI